MEYDLILEMKIESKSIYPILIPAFLLLLGIGLRFYGLERTLGTGYKGFDEGLILRYFAFSSWDLIFERYHINGINHHIFNTILLKLTVIVFGEENALAIRFPTFIFGVSCLWMIYKLAYQLFGNPTISRLSLLLAVFLPIHVAWSQTARGYSLTMFLSVSLIYATIKLLENPCQVKWGCLLFFSGFLSVYTILTNLYILFGLTCWILLALMLSGWAIEFDPSPDLRKQKVIWFAVIFLGIFALSCLVYFPMIDQIIEEAGIEQNNLNKNYYGPFAFVMVPQLISDSFQYIFKGNLQWFLPFLVSGILWGNTVRRSYRWLPIVIFFLPFTLPLVTGIAGYDRNYLFNLPLLIIFLAAGIVQIGRYLESLVSFRPISSWVIGLLTVIYIWMASNYLILEHYPLNKDEEEKHYKKNIQKYVEPFDLVLIRSHNLLLGRTVFMENIKNILLENKLSDIKLAIPNSFVLEDYLIDDGEKGFTIFKDLFSNNKFITRKVNKGNKILTVSSSQSLPVLAKDFEISAIWKKTGGSGRFFKEPSHKATGKGSIFIEANKGKDFILEAAIPGKLKINKNSFMILVWAAHIVDAPADNGEIFGPSLLLSIDQTAGIRVQPKTGRVNRGIGSLKIGSNLSSLDHFDWSIGAEVGKLPPGNYAASLVLKVLAGKSVFYDSLRLFIIEIATPP